MSKHTTIDRSGKPTRSRSTDLETLRMFWRANMEHRALFITTMTCWTAGLMLQKLGLPFIVARALTQLVNSTIAGRPIVWGDYTAYLIVFLAAALVAQLLIDVGLVGLSRLETRVRRTLQSRVYDVFMNQTMRFHADNFSGSLVNQANKFTGAYITLTDTFVLQILQLLVNVILAVVVIAFFSPMIAGAMLAWTVLFIWLNVLLTRRRMPLSRAAAAADTVLTGHLADTITNVPAIKSFGRERHEAATHDHLAGIRSDRKYASWIRAIRNDAVFGLLMSGLQLLVLALSIYGVMRSEITIVTLLLVQVYIAQIIGQLWGLSNISRSVEQNLSDAGEMTERFREPVLITDPSVPQPLRLEHGAISFENVAFAHDDNEQRLFEHFDLSIKAGEKVGLVGHSGSGKTSLTKLLLRFADVQQGRITIDGQDIRQVAQSELRSRIAYVPQEPLLFHRTIGENIAYGNLDAGDEAVETAAKQARAHEFIATLPNRYDTVVGERGVKLSGGQRQRIAIARAILKDAPVLVLDEATSALDSESEKLIQSALQDLMQGRTVIVIAHRLSTIQKLDRIVVLDDGAIVEQGTHRQLIDRKGTYAKLWAHQSGGFIED